MEDLTVLTLGRPHHPGQEAWVAPPETPEQMNQRQRLENLKNRTLKDELFETMRNVSTILRLSSSFDPWVINKALCYGDTTSELCLNKRTVDAVILPKMNPLFVDAVKTNGAQVSVYDSDTQTVHFVLFRITRSGYYLRRNWVPSFVTRRQLIPEDEIGLYWDVKKVRFVFSVLKRNCGHPSRWNLINNP